MRILPVEIPSSRCPNWTIASMRAAGEAESAEAHLDELIALLKIIFLDKPMIAIRGSTGRTTESCFNQCFSGGYGQEESNSGPRTHFHLQDPPGVNGATGFAPGIQPHGPKRTGN